MIILFLISEQPNSSVVLNAERIRAKEYRNDIENGTHNESAANLQSRK